VFDLPEKKIHKDPGLGEEVALARVIRCTTEDRGVVMRLGRQRLCRRRGLTSLCFCARLVLKRLGVEDFSECRTLRQSLRPETAACSDVI